MMMMMITMMMMRTLMVSRFQNDVDDANDGAGNDDGTDVR